MVWNKIDHNAKYDFVRVVRRLFSNFIVPHELGDTYDTSSKSYYLFLDIHEVFFLNMVHTIMAEIISTTKLKDLNGEYLEVVHIYMGLISWSAILFITKVTFFIELLGNSRLNIIFKNGDWASEPIDISWNNHESNRYRSWQWGFY